jgi:two-component system sensor kinase FixL
MPDPSSSQIAQDAAEQRVEHFRQALGPFVVAAENTRMAMILTDEEIERHPVVFANDSFLSLSGFRRREILGKGIAYLLRAVTDRNTLSIIESALDAGLSDTVEAQCRRADGSEYLATVFFSPVPDDRGVIRQYFLCFVEVSGRIDRLLRQRDEFNMLYERAPGFIAVSEGPEHRFKFANAAYKQLVGREHLIGRRIVDALPELAEQGFVELLDQVFRTGEPFVGTNVPVRLLTDAGRGSMLHYLNFVYQPVRDEQDLVAGLFIEGFDVTAERLAAEQLAIIQDDLTHASRVNAMGMMAATLAHELNQPLTAVANYAGTCSRLVDPSSHNASLLVEALGGIEAAAQRAGDIIRNVRELTRRGETPKATFNLKLAVSECVRLVSAGGCPAAAIDNHTPDDLLVLGDRIQIQQVLINLLRNGCDATEGKLHGRVTVDAARKGGEVVVSITDTGSGLSVEVAENIFNWTSSTKEAGTGLGLAISRTIVEAHNGRIWLERSDEFGSRFCFSVPLASTDGGSDGD